jgi:hypothetical protein
LWDMFNKIKKWNISKRVMFLHMKDYIIWILAIEIAYKFDWWLNTTNFYIFLLETVNLSMKYRKYNEAFSVCLVEWVYLINSVVVNFFASRLRYTIDCKFWNF